MGAVVVVTSREIWRQTSPIRIGVYRSGSHFIFAVELEFAVDMSYNLYEAQEETGADNGA